MSHPSPDLMAWEWEDAIIEGIAARQMADKGRWILGDLALAVALKEAPIDC